MPPYNVDCLKHDELRFELLVRGVQLEPESKAQTPELRKWLRKLLREKTPTDALALKDKIKIVDEVDACSKKHVELKSLLEGISENSPNLHKVRHQSRLNHLLFRISCLLQFELGGS